MSIDLVFKKHKETSMSLEESWRVLKESCQS